MPRILSFGDKNIKIPAEGVFKKIWNIYNSQNKFTKFYILFAILIASSTPAIISSYLIFNPQAASNSNLGDAWSQAPSRDSPVVTGSSMQPQSITSYTVDKEIKDHLNLLNNYRAQNGVGSLTPVKSLTDLAKWMSEDMASNNYFSHTDSLGRDPFSRMDAFGYSYNTWRGENLAVGSNTASEAMNLWKGSPGHNANMLNANYTAVGIYRAFSSSSTFGWYWVQEFGGYIDTPVAYYVPSSTPTPSPKPIGPSGFTFCANEGNTCSFSGTAQVAFGANVKFSYGNFTNSVLCSWKNFPDPLPGVSKYCFYKSIEFPVSTGSLGDTNCSGNIEAEDSSMILKYVGGLINGSTICNGNNSLYRPAADVDSNGIIDTKDSLQILRYIAGLPSVLNSFTMSAHYQGDSDGDGSSDGTEIYIGTDRNKSCGVKAWPPDIDNNKVINIIDLSAMISHYNTTYKQDAYDPRFDLNNDGRINTTDVLSMNRYFGKTCR